MKLICCSTALLFMSFFLQAQVSISTGSATPDPNAMLDIQSATKGLLPPRLSNSAIMGIANPAAGMVAFNTDLQCLMIYQGGKWDCLGVASSHPMEAVLSTVQFATGTGTSELQDVKINADGSYCVMGNFTGNLVLGQQTLLNPGSIQYGLVAKYNPDGTVAWALQFNSTVGITPKSIALDAAGNIYITGSYKGTADFLNVAGQVAQSLSTASLNATNMFLVKITATGVYDWMTEEAVFNATASLVEGNGVCLIDNRVAVTGSFFNSVSFGTGAAAVTLSSVGIADIFIAVYDTVNATLDWAQRKGGIGLDKGIDIVSGIDRLYITGIFSETVIFQSSPVASLGQEDIFVGGVPMDTKIWYPFNALGSNLADAVTSIDSYFDTYVISGQLTGPVSFGGTDIPIGNFILALNSSVNHVISLKSVNFRAVHINDVAILSPSATVAAGNFSVPFTCENNYILYPKNNGQDIFYLQNRGAALSTYRAVSVSADGTQDGNAVAIRNNISFVVGSATGVCRFGNFVHDFGAQKTMYIWKIIDN